MTTTLVTILAQTQRRRQCEKHILYLLADPEFIVSPSTGRVPHRIDSPTNISLILIRIASDLARISSPSAWEIRPLGSASGCGA